MGGRSAFGRPANRVDLASAVLEGLPAESCAALTKRLHLSRAESATVLGVSVRTLDRLTGGGKRLSVTSSDRLARVARIYVRATEVLESEANAAAWLREPNKYLDGESPLDALATDYGTTRVTDMLDRMEYGVYA
ncbi:MAG: DUF2384 domain-containing protein [Gammaproteobacteria bacterium]|nr:DUF2384 domain-containing protein [Gammaproteobacteria bacterium]